MIAIRLANLFELDYSVAAPWRLQKLEMNPLRRVGNRDPFDFSQPLDAALDLGGFSCLGAETLDEALLLADFKFLPPGGGLPCLDILLPGENVAIIAAAVEDDIVGLDGNDFTYDIVEKSAVMRCNEDGTVIVFKVTLEPALRFQVEMVRPLNSDSARPKSDSAKPSPERIIFASCSES
jgi:hypothetical protein